MILQPGQLIQRLDGIDGSHWQPDAGPMDLGMVRAVTGWFAWKATQGDRSVDPTHRQVRAATARLGFRHRLWYHWITPNDPVDAQADHYLATIGQLAPGEGVMLDAEQAGITETACLRWLDRVEAVTGRPCSVYSGLYVAGGTIWRSPRIRTGVHGARPMHLAAYLTPSSLWRHLLHTGAHELDIAAWQWSSNGPVPGITGRCDMNTIFDVPAFDRCCGVTPANDNSGEVLPDDVTPPTTEDAMPIVTNAEQFFDASPAVAKFVLQDNGRLRLLDGVEWATRGSLPGTPWSNDDIGRHGVDH